MLVDLLKAYSPPGHEEKAVKVLQDYAISLGFDTVRIDGAGNIIAEVGYGEKSIALIGHIDTVPGELPVEVDGDVVRGRGAVDAKGPLVAMFIGATLAKKVIDLDKHRVYVIAAVGEEGDSRGAKELIRQGFKANGIIVGEPSNNSIVLGYRGSMKVLIRCSSMPSHSSSPPLEPPVYEKLINIWTKIKEKYSIFKAQFTTATILSIRCGDDVALGYSVYPNEGYMIVDLRIGIEDTLKNVDGYLQNLISQFNSCSYNVLDYTHPVKTSITNTIVRALTRAIIVEGEKPRFVYKLGTSDMNLLQSCTSNIVAYGPGKSELSHTNKEEISIEEVLYGAKVYRSAIREFFKLF
jgi:LysW-gamma-L-lysine carboxypeptidase